MYIHEPIHGEIKLSELALKIIDHPYYDRTHYIYQTGTAYKVFPSATHSRKVHMIGTYGMTKNLLDNLSQTHRIDEHTKELIAIGGYVMILDMDQEVMCLTNILYLNS